MCMVMLTYSIYGANGQHVTDKTKFVNQFVGTSGDYGQLTPSATLPFGLVKIGPETDPGNQAGYDYKSTRIKGFTINRMEGVGCKGAGANILVKPGFGDTTQVSSLFEKESETASPGYYRVILTKPTIEVRLTATNATGWQQYTYNTSGKAWIMINLSYSLDDMIEEIHKIRGNTIDGSIKAKSVCKLGTYKFYYHLEVNKKADSIIQKGSKIWYLFSVLKNEQINVWTSVSSISPEQAHEDRKKELGSLNFEKVKQKASEAWNKKLAKIIVKGKEEYVKLFYTHYYHTLLSPSQLNGPSGIYRGSDNKIYNTKGYTYYHGWSLWDNFRTEMPLLTITEPSVMNDICRSLIELYKQGKAPWGTETEPFPTVRTEHAIITLLDCYRKGIKSFDLNSVYPFLKKEAAQYPNKTPDQKLERAYDYWALSQIASILNQKFESEIFKDSVFQYRKIWNEKFRIMNNQSDIMHGDGLYEGTLWQYRWFVPYDTKGMMIMLGGESEFTNQLEYFFNQNLYNHSNEPDINVPYLFNFTAKPYLTQYWVNKILTKQMEQWYATHTKWTTPYLGRIYKLAPEGYIPEMDDDAGTMSAWYVLSSMGLYPACIGEPVYCITSPIFSNISIKLSGIKVFQIIANNGSDKNIYIQKAKLNGKALNRCWITHKEIIQGGTLVYELGDKPNPEWGKSFPYITTLETSGQLIK